MKKQLSGRMLEIASGMSSLPFSVVKEYCRRFERDGYDVPMINSEGSIISCYEIKGELKNTSEAERDVIRMIESIIDCK